MITHFPCFYYNGPFILVLNCPKQSFSLCWEQKKSRQSNCSFKVSFNQLPDMNWMHSAQLPRLQSDSTFKSSRTLLVWPLSVLFFCFMFNMIYEDRVFERQQHSFKNVEFTADHMIVNIFHMFSCFNVNIQGQFHCCRSHRWVREVIEIRWRSPWTQECIWSTILEMPSWGRNSGPAGVFLPFRFWQAAKQTETQNATMIQLHPFWCLSSERAQIQATHSCTFHPFKTHTT